MTVGGIVETAASIALGIACGPWASLMMLGTDAVDAADEMLQGRDAGEAMFDLGKDALLAGGSMGLGMLGLGSIQSSDSFFKIYVLRRNIE